MEQGNPAATAATLLATPVKLLVNAGDGPATQSI